MTLPKDYHDDITSDNSGKTKPNKKYLQIKIPVILLIVIAISAGTFFVGYFSATYQKVGYSQGYDTGYMRGAQDLFEYNVNPDSWIVLDQKVGIAAMNGTNVVFAWQDSNQNTTKTLAFKSETPSQYQVIRGVLVLMSDPIKVPQQIANSTGLHPKVHYIFEDQNRNKYLLEPDR